MKNRSVFINGVIFVACLLISGCATMFSPGSDQVTIKSSPEGANVYEGANFLGKTPLTHTFKRETFEERTLIIKKEGYATRELLLKKSMEKTALLNFGFIITSGATSWGIDAVTGHMIKYSPDSYFIELQKKGAASGDNDDRRWEAVRFVLLNQHSLMKDIASGDGDYLRAFFELKSSQATIPAYTHFLHDISGKAVSLLRFDDAVDFYNGLQKI